MLANAAGPIYSIYGLVHKMEKMHFLGVGARFFLQRTFDILLYAFSAVAGIRMLFF